MIYRNSFAIVCIVLEVCCINFWTGSIRTKQQKKVIKRINEGKARRMIGGDNDVNGTFNFAVSLESDEPVYSKVYRICSGSLISDSWVLTAAHCCISSVTRIRYGDARAPQNATNTFSEVIDAIPHPSFKYYTPGKVRIANNDIGLLLVQKVPANIEFGKLCAVDYKSILGQLVKLAGFGSASLKSLHNTNTQLKVIDALSIQCGDIIPLKPAICVVSKCHTRMFLWRGDSGGPLLYDGKIAGVASIGKPPTLSGGFTPVSPYLDWIYNTIKTGCQK